MNPQKGTISNWNEEKGFGFILPESGGKTLFAHINDYSRTHENPFSGLEVEYFISTDQKGRKCAVDVRPLRGYKKPSPSSRQRIISTFLFSGFAVVLYILCNSKLIPLELVGLYTTLSLMAFIMYAKDKSAAEWGKWRTAESTLHILSLLGGWPGASLAQSFLRHKSKKMSFRVTFWITVLVNCGALYWLITPEGSLWLRNIIRNINHG
ncbi:MAG: cold shock and DUF1294 domain-containing protein [Desulfobulbaceae bacterium]|nr:cold shock and DUF1294 domain-containing protein [Desulfobulbaceae bacterium]